MKLHRIIGARGRMLPGAALLGLAMLASQPASAALVSSDFDGSDCAGFFGDTFDACEIFINDDGERIELSPVIAKFQVDSDGTLSGAELNTDLYPSIDGSEFDVTTDGGLTGTFNYTPTGDDPGMKYWVAKYANLFTLFWDVDQSVVDAGTCSPDAYNLDCLNAANTVEFGSWFTNGQNAISHITFYNTEPPRKVPAPGVLGLLAVGLLGLVAAARRRRF